MSVGELKTGTARGGQVVTERHARAEGNNSAWTLVLADLELVASEKDGAQRELMRASEALMKNSLDVICSIDGAGLFLQVTAASEAMWGYRPDELIGVRYMDLVCEEDRELTTAVAASIMNGEAVRSFENRYTRKDGSRMNVMWSAVWSDVDQLMYCVARDVTEVNRGADRLSECAARAEQLAAAGQMGAVVELLPQLYEEIQQAAGAVRAFVSGWGVPQT